MHGWMCRLSVRRLVQASLFSRSEFCGTLSVFSFPPYIFLGCEVVKLAEQPGKVKWTTKNQELGILPLSEMILTVAC